MPPMSTATLRFFKALPFAYWIEMLARFATLVKSSISFAKIFRSSSGAEETGSIPNASHFFLTSGAFSRSLMARLSLATIGAGVFAGAKIAVHVVCSMPGRWTTFCAKRSQPLNPVRQNRRLAGSPRKNGTAEDSARPAAEIKTRGNR